MTHVTDEEIEKVQNLIKTLQIRQSLLSETTLSSEDALCPICYANPNSAVFKPCEHQSCQLVNYINSIRKFYLKNILIFVVGIVSFSI